MWLVHAPLTPPILSNEWVQLPTYFFCPLVRGLKALFHSIGCLVASDRMQFASDLVSDLGSEAPFHSKQMLRTRDNGLTHNSLNPINVPNLCFENNNHSWPITSSESQLAIQFFYYRLPLFPVQVHAVSGVNIVAKSNKFPFPTILV